MQIVAEGPAPECAAAGCTQKVEIAKTGVRAGDWKITCSPSCAAKYSNANRVANTQSGVRCTRCSRDISRRTMSRHGGSLTMHPSCETAAKKQEKKRIQIQDEFWTCVCGVRTNRIRLNPDDHCTPKCKTAWEKKQQQLAKPSPEPDNNGYDAKAMDVAIAKIVAREKAAGNVGATVRLLDAVEAVREKEAA